MPARVTVAESLVWDSGDPTGRRWQLVDGEPQAMIPGNATHGALSSEFGALLGNRLFECQSPCRVVTGPGIVPRLRPDRNYWVPDLGVSCAPPSTGKVVSEPVLLVEILSPSNEAETWANIWAYISIPSITEILALHGTRIEAELLRRAPDGTWPEQPEVIRHHGVRHLAASVDFSTPLAAVYRTTSLASR